MPFQGRRALSIELLRNATLVLFLAVVMTTDWLPPHRIPNVATFPAMLAGLVLGAAQAFPGAFAGGGFVDSLAGLVLAFVATFPLYAMGGLKAGDVKLLMAIGALKGVVFLLYAGVYGALLGGVFAAGHLVLERVRRGRPFGATLRTFIPYGVALGLGALLALAQNVGR